MVSSINRIHSPAARRAFYPDFRGTDFGRSRHASATNHEAGSSTMRFRAPMQRSTPDTGTGNSCHRLHLAHKRASAPSPRSNDANLGGLMKLKPKVITRSDYLIDGHRVIFDSGAGWQCVCAEFTATDECRHIRESQGRHAAQVLIANRISLGTRQS